MRVLRMEALNMLDGDGSLINMMNSKWSLLGKTTLTVLNSGLVDNLIHLREERDGGWSGSLEDRMVNLLYLAKHHVRRWVRAGGHHLE